MRKRQSPKATFRARENRSEPTEAESLMWYVLRGRRLGGFKFRREYPIEPHIVDFACVEERLIIEVDGEYHESVYEKDLARQRWIEQQGWEFLRFTNEEVLSDVESVAVAIVRKLDGSGRIQKPR